jgi:aubergine-like protein
VEKFILQLTYLYYNVTAAVKIPAPAYYAHILSNFVGDRFDPRRPEETFIKPHARFLDIGSLYFI